MNYYESIKTELVRLYKSDRNSLYFESSLNRVLARIAWARRFRKINDEEFSTLRKMFLGLTERGIEYDFKTNECYYTDDWQKAVI